MAPSLLQSRRIVAKATAQVVDTIAPTRTPETRTLAIEAIIRETGCRRSEAKKTLAWIEGFVEEARQNGYRLIYPTTAQMSSTEYDIFDEVMPHGATSAPGSAHRAIETALLDPSRDEFTLIHDQREDGDESVDSPAYCMVQVCLGVMR